MDEVIDNLELKDKQEELNKNLAHYRNILMYMGANVPIQVLCLPKVIESALINDGCIRVYDMINRDLAKVKGIGRERLDVIESRLDNFFTVSI